MKAYPQIDIATLIDLQKRPPLFERGEDLFWDDPHISQHMLAAHLDPHTDAASRNPATIDKSVEWLCDQLQLKKDSHLLDLGCGPGLYAQRFAQHGIVVTGVDYSRRSLAYAQEQAELADLDITYRYQNYLTLDDTARYDAVVLIYGDYCVLNPNERQTLLANIKRALKPGGRFALDVSTRLHRQYNGLHTNWYAGESGFWKPGPHIVLEQGFDYPQHDIFLDQYIVIEADTTLSIYRNWYQDYNPASISAELEDAGFDVTGMWGDLTGTAYTPETEWIAVISQVN